MRELGTLTLDAGDELRVEVDRDDLSGDEIVVRRATDDPPPPDGLLAIVDEHLATAERHAAGAPIG